MKREEKLWFIFNSADGNLYFTQ